MYFRPNEAQLSEADRLAHRQGTAMQLQYVTKDNS